MMAEPMAPGRGLPVYQPATVVVVGTCRAPLDCRPRVTGLATATGSDDCGGATIGPVGAGSAPTPGLGGSTAAVECRVSSNPSVPATRTTRPAATMIAAGLRKSAI